MRLLFLLSRRLESRLKCHLPPDVIRLRPITAAPDSVRGVSDLTLSNPKKPQSEVLSEFRITLNEEIEAVRRHASSSAVPLINGRRIAQISWNYQYIFQIENFLNLPGDAPGDLFNRQPL